MLLPSSQFSESHAPAAAGPIPKVTPEIGNRIIDAVENYGMSLLAAQKKYGIVGFCWGGGRSFLHATHPPGLGASVVYYGSPPSAEQMAAIKAPVLGRGAGVAEDRRVLQGKAGTLGSRRPR